MDRPRGSQLHLQVYANELVGDLTAAVVEAFPDLTDAASSIVWRSPLRQDSYREVRDGAFLDLVDLSRLRPDRAAFWPSRGPVWDGLAIFMRSGGRPGVILVEGKAHPKELVSSCAAGTKSRSLIDKRLAELRTALGVPSSCAGAWLDRHYQLANRLAFAHWLRGRGVDARLLNVGFSNDATNRPTDARLLERALIEAWRSLGVEPGRLAYVGAVILPAADPDLWQAPALK